MANLTDVVSYTNNLLTISKFRDYAPNGLQVEGKPEVNKLVVGVTACQALLDAAIKADADLILVHHGYFWQGETPSLVGIKAKRVKILFAADVSLLGYHLPLDAHAVYGNNAQLAKILGIDVQGPIGDREPDNYIFQGKLSSPMSADTFARHIATQLQRQPLHISGHSDEINTIVWCTGGAQRYIEQAVALGVDAYITGEASEQTVHIAREAGIHFFAAGHHATERYGVQALGQHLADQFKLDYQFIDIDNPV